MKYEWSTIPESAKFEEVSIHGEVRVPRCLLHGRRVFDVKREPTIHPATGEPYFAFWNPETKKQSNILLKKLVARAFVPNPHGYKYVCYYEGKSCRASNLYWSETQERGTTDA